MTEENKLVNVGEPTKAPQPFIEPIDDFMEEVIKLYDEPMERAIARELFKLAQDQLRALLDEVIDHDELV